MAEAGPQSLWYASRDGQESGPFLMYELQDRFQSGEIAADDFVWCAETDDWLPAARVLGGQASPAPVAVISTSPAGAGVPKFSIPPPAPLPRTERSGSGKKHVKKNKAWGAASAQSAAPVRGSEAVSAPPAHAPKPKGRSLKPLTIGLIMLGVFLPFLLPIFWFAAWRTHMASART